MGSRKHAFWQKGGGFSYVFALPVNKTEISPHTPLSVQAEEYYYYYYYYYFYMLYKPVTIVAWQGSLPAFLLSYLTGDTVYMEVIWLCACEDRW